MTSRIETTPASLYPTRILYLEYKHHGKGTTRVSDLTNQLDPFYSPSTGLHEDFLKEAKSIADSLDSPLQALYIFKKENILGSKVTIKDAEGNTVAEESNPVLSSGKARFTFPKQSLHSSHDVEIKPVGFMNSAESFVKDGVNYFWEIEEHQLERRIMSKEVEGKRINIAQYAQKSGNVKEGVLILDEIEIDDLISVLTLYACLNIPDSLVK